MWFKQFKKSFAVKGEPLTLQVDPILALRRNRYTVPHEVMRLKIFEPIMKDIICLIQEQLSMAGDAVAAVILVGGFGQSQYLKSRIREATPAGIEVLQPLDGWTAVVKGGVIHGLGDLRPGLAGIEIASRIARQSFGTCLMTKYDMMRHEPKEA